MLPEGLEIKEEQERSSASRPLLAPGFESISHRSPLRRCLLDADESD